MLTKIKSMFYGAAFAAAVTAGSALPAHAQAVDFSGKTVN